MEEWRSSDTSLPVLLARPPAWCEKERCAARGRTCAMMYAPTRGAPPPHTHNNTLRAVGGGGPRPSTPSSFLNLWGFRMPRTSSDGSSRSSQSSGTRSFRISNDSLLPGSSSPPHRPRRPSTPHPAARPTTRSANGTRSMARFVSARSSFSSRSSTPVQNAGHLIARRVAA